MWAWLSCGLVSEQELADMHFGGCLMKLTEEMVKAKKLTKDITMLTAIPSVARNGPPAPDPQPGEKMICWQCRALDADEWKGVLPWLTFYLDREMSAYRRAADCVASAHNCTLPAASRAALRKRFDAITKAGGVRLLFHSNSQREVAAAWVHQHQDSWINKHIAQVFFDPARMRLVLQDFPPKQLRIVRLEIADDMFSPFELDGDMVLKQTLSAYFEDSSDEELIPDEELSWLA
jgi:hypothetical protein